MDSHANAKKQSSSNIPDHTTQEDFVPDTLSGLDTFLDMQNAIKQPNENTLTSKAVLQLQRTIGNQAVQTLLAKKSVQRNVVPPPPRPQTPVRTRQLDFVTIKIQGRGVDHWWVELDGTESYGWWPAHGIGGLTDQWNIVVGGTTGILNAQGRGSVNGLPPGTATTDPHHGDSAAETFHPYTINRSNGLNDHQIRERIRRFARGFSGDYRIIVGPNCHTFITSLMESVGLSRGRPTSTETNLP